MTDEVRSLSRVILMARETKVDERTIELLVQKVLSKEVTSIRDLQDLDNAAEADIDGWMEFKGYRIKEIMMEGFGPHEGPNVITMEGKKNLILGPNGSGKTHIAQAVIWCLFGDTGSLDPWLSSDEVKADLRNWSFPEGLPARVIVSFELDGDIWKFERSLNDPANPAVFRSHKGRWVKTSKVPGVNRLLLPFTIYQGERSSFLASELPFLEKGLLYKAAELISGSLELEFAGHTLSELRDALSMEVERNAESNRVSRKRISSLRKDMKANKQELNALEKEISEMQDGIGSSKAKYLEVIRNLTQELDDGDPALERARAAKRTGIYVERSHEYWSRASIEFLRPLAEPALKRARKKKGELERMKMMAGAISAQLSIVEEIFRRKSCICGKSIAKTGMGRERLEHLMEVLERKREKNSTCIEPSIWTSENFLISISSDLSRKPFGGREIDKTLKKLKSSQKDMVMFAEPRNRKKAKDDIVRAIREHEKGKLLLQDARSKRNALRKRLSSLEKELKAETDSLVKRSPFQQLENDHEKWFNTLDASISKVRTMREERLLTFRKDIGSSSTRFLNMIRPHMNEEIAIHEDSMQIGLKRDEAREKRTIPLWRLSAGEREAVILSMVLSISRLAKMNLILDSPLSNMDAGSIERCLDIILERDGVLLMAPTGFVSKEKLKRLKESTEKDLTIFSLEITDGRSNLKEVS